jgi:hypothetical protein
MPLGKPKKKKKNSNKISKILEIIADTFEFVKEDEFREHMKDNKHGKTTEIIRISEFTTEGYLPKVFLPFYTPPGHLPRKVQMDRLVKIFKFTQMEF